jgi:hypothetical protein
VPGETPNYLPLLLALLDAAIDAVCDALRPGEVLNDRSLDWRTEAHADRDGQQASNPELELSSIHSRC